MGSGQTEGITGTAQDAQFAEQEGKIETALTSKSDGRGQGHHLTPFTEAPAPV